MEKVLSFLSENWKELSVLLVAILTFLVSMLRKKGKVDPVVEYVLTQVPDVIIAAEERVGSGNGEEKKRIVMSMIGLIYKKLTGYILKEDSKYFSLFSKYVELVLSTPQKKEDK